MTHRNLPEVFVLVRKNPLVSPYGTQRNSTEDSINKSVKIPEIQYCMDYALLVLTVMHTKRGNLHVCHEHGKFVSEPPLKEPSVGKQ